MKEILLSIIIGYLLGALSPAALISKLKKVDLRENGTRNLGATNTMLTFGKLYGALVMLFDIAKSAFAVLLVKALFPEMPVVGLLAGTFAVVGHIFPFYMRFKGGKGLAAFAGLVLAFDPMIFLLLLVLCTSLMLIVNYSYIMPLSAGALFPLLAALKSGELSVLLITLFAGLLIIFKHASNYTKAKNGNEIKVREYIKNNLFRRST